MTGPSETEIQTRMGIQSQLARELLKLSMLMPGHSHWICIGDKQLSIYAQSKVPAGSEMIFDLLKYQRCAAGMSSETTRLMDVVLAKIKGGKL